MMTNTPTLPMSMHPFILSAYKTLDIESASILQLKSQIDNSFVQVVDLFCQTQGRVIITGMGKSGHIGKKISATLSSTGTPSFFMHPAEASHGDLGMVTKADVIVAISNSGESDELNVILPLLKRAAIPIVAMTGNRQSTLAQHANLVISTFVEQEACRINLAPTASTTAQLAMGDALAIACMEQRGFQAIDFAASHPGGALGRRLFTRVSHIMRTGNDLPIVQTDMSFLDMMKLMSDRGLGLAITVNNNGIPEGIFTDGDLRRELVSGTDLIHTPIKKLMRAHPKILSAEALAVDAVAIMEQQRITSILATNPHGVLVGVLNTNDLLRAKVI